jgi:hypothetical protein
MEEGGIEGGVFVWRNGCQRKLIQINKIREFLPLPIEYSAKPIIHKISFHNKWPDSIHSCPT